MKKIPTMFERDWNGDRSRVVNQVHPGCEWVFAGEGVATRKLDGTSCMVHDCKLYKRREVKKGELLPQDFQTVGHDDETGKTVGWVPVGDASDDRWHREAFAVRAHADGTYELVGPKIQGNPEKWNFHELIPHNDPDLVIVADAPREFESLKRWLEGKDIEGLVFHHPDGRMAKIKLRDFGFKRAKQ